MQLNGTYVIERFTLNPYYSRQENCGFINMGELIHIFTDQKRYFHRLLHVEYCYQFDYFIIHIQFIQPSNHRFSVYILRINNRFFHNNLILSNIQKTNIFKDLHFLIGKGLYETLDI